MIHQGKETTFGYDLYESNLPGTSSGNDMPGFSSGGQWNGGTAFCNDLPGTTFGHDSHVTTFGPQYVPDELNGSPSTGKYEVPRFLVNMIDIKTHILFWVYFSMKRNMY